MTGRCSTTYRVSHSSALLSRATAALEPPRPALGLRSALSVPPAGFSTSRNLSAGASNKALRLRLGAGPLAFRLPPAQRASEKENSNVYLESAHNHRLHWQ